MTETLRVAIIHYHLHPGGVTRIIENSVAALSEKGIQTTVLTGALPHEAYTRLPNTQLVKELAYGTAGDLSDEDLVERLLEAAKKGLGAEPDIWHFHNHSLGKNAVIPRLVQVMARRGLRLLLHIHDFAEDGRPANYQFLVQHIGGGNTKKLGERLYPAAEHVHYAVLNGRDLRFLTESGLPKGRLHYLPNPVQMDLPDESVLGAISQRMFIYPTRGIRRKNIGEFILWSALAGEGDNFAVTRAPRNPIFKPVYKRWIEFAKSLRLPVEFDVAGKGRVTFNDLIRRAFAFVTTSVAEGFGLGFLEPWFVGKPLVGRKLPEITSDFEDNGINLGGMYDFLGVPVDWVGREALRSRITSELDKYLIQYGRNTKPEYAERALSSMVINDRVDFGRLDEEFQEVVIRKVSGSSSARREIGPALLESGFFSQSVVESNQEIVRCAFSLDNYGDRLERIYQDIMSSSTGDVSGISAEALLERFLAPERFCLLRTT